MPRKKRGKSGGSDPRASTEGFALVVTTVLMGLLALLGMGMLTLATIDLRSTQLSQAQAVARSNARMALMVALGELQKETGQDKRITVTADQLPAAEDGGETAAAVGKRHWTGVYDSWDSVVKNRPAPSFRKWLVSGSREEVKDLSSAKQAPRGEAVTLASTGRDPDGQVKVAKVPVAGVMPGHHAWWVGDQGVKAAINTDVPSLPNAKLAEVRQAMFSAPRAAAELAATSGGAQPFQSLGPESPQLERLASWGQAALVADRPAEVPELFHDFAAYSSGLLTNVAAGGFRKDLSMYLEQPLQTTPLYTVDGEKGINMGELWLFYNSWKELKTSGQATYTTGGTMAEGTPHFQVEARQSDYEKNPYSTMYINPSYVNIQSVLSLYGHEVTVAKGRKVTRLALVEDPLITVWNPLDVPLKISPAYFSIKYWVLPYDLTLRYAGKTSTIPLHRITGGGQWHYATLQIGKTKQVVLKPGEVVMFSQGANTPITFYDPTLNFVPAEEGWNLGGGMAFDIKDLSKRYIEIAPDDVITYSVTPNHTGSEIGSGDTDTWMLTGHTFCYKEDRPNRGEFYQYGALNIDSRGEKPSARLWADEHPEFFGKINDSETRPLTGAQLIGRKEPFMLFSMRVKTELEAERRGRFLARYNPKSPWTDFQLLTPDELDTYPFEIHIAPLDSWKSRHFEVSPTGASFFGGGWTRDTGVERIITNTIPREPIHSLAAFQNAFANGFDASTRNQFNNHPLHPQVLHAIGNSMAQSVIPPDKTSSSLTGPRALADHSYLANQALWDDWFLSGIAPQTAASFTDKRDQQAMAADFLSGKELLPNRRYQPYLLGMDPDEALNQLFRGRGGRQNKDAETIVSTMLRVSGMFNVNSASVEAWKAVLGGLHKLPITVNDGNGKDSVANSQGVPVTHVASPLNLVADEDSARDITNVAGWGGRRELSETELDSLARQIVREVRKRGPFLSLADFVNRRVGKDKKLALAGAIQSALDSENVTVNKAYNRGDRALTDLGSGRGFAFPEAEVGPSAYGIPGIVKQADILTPLAPFLSVRSDTFLIRAYGDCVDSNGTVLAQAWCEAQVTRVADFLDGKDKAETEILKLKSGANKKFGRRYVTESFRWLSKEELL